MQQTEKTNVSVTREAELQRKCNAYAVEKAAMDNELEAMKASSDAQSQRQMESIREAEAQGKRCGQFDFGALLRHDGGTMS